MNSIHNVDSLIWIKEEKIKDNGEDSLCFDCVSRPGAIMMSVFDGCGGSGARKYPIFGDKTGAYLGSKIVSGVVHGWFKSLINIQNESEWSEQLKELIVNAMTKYKNCVKSTSKIKGTIRKEFPTTMATIILKEEKSVCRGHFMWAGDSRAYVLDNRGLHQVTDDDVNTKDAMSNLKDDGVLTNVISLSKDFHINRITRDVGMKSIMICATDGCYGYLESPMHFEYLLLDSLMKSNNPSQWREEIRKYLSTVSGDDFTMILTIYGFGNFIEVKNNFKTRKEYLEKAYISQWSKAEEENRNKLWLQYRKELSKNE